LNATFMEFINKADAKCGYTKYLNEALTYPPKKPFPEAPDPQNVECDTYDQIYAAATFVNPCFNYYHLTDYCPYLWDEMGFPSLGDGPNDYFNRTDVQIALHAPPTNYLVCGESDVFPNGDFSDASALGPLPSVIERTNNVLIGHGWLDYLLFMNGTLATIQNMTWNGAQGFQKPPTEPLFVPYHESLFQLVDGNPPTPFLDNAGAGYLGTAHTERGLTFTSVFNSGHGLFSLPAHHDTTENTNDYEDTNRFMIQSCPNTPQVQHSATSSFCSAVLAAYPRSGHTQHRRDRWTRAGRQRTKRKGA